MKSLFYQTHVDQSSSPLLLVLRNHSNLELFLFLDSKLSTILMWNPSALWYLRGLSFFAFGRLWTYSQGSFLIERVPLYLPPCSWHPFKSRVYEGFCMPLIERLPCIHLYSQGNIFIYGYVRVFLCDSLVHLHLGVWIYSVTAKSCALLHKLFVNIPLTV